jgi:hypothetical protein
LSTKQNSLVCSSQTRLSKNGPLIFHDGSADQPRTATLGSAQQGSTSLKPKTGRISYAPTPLRLSPDGERWNILPSQDSRTNELIVQYRYIIHPSAKKGKLNITVRLRGRTGDNHPSLSYLVCACILYPSAIPGNPIKNWKGMGMQLAWTGSHPSLIGQGMLINIGDS